MIGYCGARGERGLMPMICGECCSLTLQPMYGILSIFAPVDLSTTRGPWLHDHALFCSFWSLIFDDIIDPGDYQFAYQAKGWGRFYMTARESNINIKILRRIHIENVALRLQFCLRSTAMAPHKVPHVLIMSLGFCSPRDESCFNLHANQKHLYLEVWRLR
jgi:hypothetical protein